MSIFRITANDRYVDIEAEDVVKVETAYGMSLKIVDAAAKIVAYYNVGCWDSFHRLK